MNVFPESLFPRAVLLKLIPSDSFIRIMTVDHTHGRSSFFYIDFYALRTWFYSTMVTPFRDVDMLNTLSICGSKGTFTLSITWLRDTGLHGGVNGYRQRLEKVPFSAIEKALNGEQVSLLCNADFPNITVRIDPSVQKKMTTLCKDKLVRSALKKALRSCFQYPDTETCLYPDFGIDFCFSCDDGLRGGLCYSEGPVCGQDGNTYTRIRYSVHT
ncbi:MAG: hypothetical protein IJR97_14320 [Clostridia bacterium]|nr:hypothetical protein [Clostridia bacterium]